MGYLLSDESREIVQTYSSSWDSEEEEGPPSLPNSNWNEGFQALTKRIRSFTPQTTASEQIEAYSDLISLTEDFLKAVESYGRIIISEAHLPVSERTVKPTSLGGVIGGQKYLVQGMGLFLARVMLKALRVFLFFFC